MGNPGRSLCHDEIMTPQVDIIMNTSMMVCHGISSAITVNLSMYTHHLTYIHKLTNAHICTTLITAPHTIVKELTQHDVSTHVQGCSQKHNQQDKTGQTAQVIVIQYMTRHTELSHAHVTVIPFSL